MSIASSCLNPAGVSELGFDPINRRSVRLIPTVVADRIDHRWRSKAGPTLPARGAQRPTRGHAPQPASCRAISVSSRGVPGAAFDTFHTLCERFVACYDRHGSALWGASRDRGHRGRRCDRSGSKYTADGSGLAAVMVPYSMVLTASCWSSVWYLRQPGCGLRQHLPSVTANKEPHNPLRRFLPSGSL